jgi:hypothetical protein
MDFIKPDVNIVPLKFSELTDFIKPDVNIVPLKFSELADGFYKTGCE